MKVPAHKIAAWEAATYPNVVANLAARADAEELKRVCEVWVKARGRDAADATAIEQQMQKFAAIDIADKAEEQLSRLRALVDKQAEDEGLWFAAQTAPEAYLQAQLRLLHAVIEDAGD